MLASLAALHLLVLAQAPVPPDRGAPPEPGVKVADEPQDAPPAQAGPSEAPSSEAPPLQNAPLPRKPERGAPAASSEAPPAETAPAARVPLAPPVALPIVPRQLSLLSAEPLSGGSAALVQAGWSSLSVMYAQSLTATDDLGALLDFDVAKTELRLGVLYRRPLGSAGPFRMAGRLTASWYANYGGTWFYGENRHDRGFEVAPGLSLSAPAAGGVFSILGDAPVTITVKRGSGLLFSPRVSLAYEAPLYEPYTVGVRAGLGYRGGAGDAPLIAGRAEVTFLLLGGVQLF